MVHKTVIISAPHGIHTRPAALVVRAAKSFDCDVHVEYDGRRANAKNLLRLLTLAIGQGAQVTVSASGQQAQQAVDEVSTLISSVA